MARPAAWPSCSTCLPVIFLTGAWASRLVALVCLGLMAATFRSGAWVRYSLSDMVAAVFRLAGSALIGAGEMQIKGNAEPPAEDVVIGEEGAPAVVRDEASHAEFEHKGEAEPREPDPPRFPASSAPGRFGHGWRSRSD